MKIQIILVLKNLNPVAIHEKTAGRQTEVVMKIIGYI
jgi:hypothetical protein